MTVASRGILETLTVAIISAKSRPSVGSNRANVSKIWFHFFAAFAVLHANGAQTVVGQWFAGALLGGGAGQKFGAPAFFADPVGGVAAIADESGLLAHQINGVGQ